MTLTADEVARLLRVRRATVYSYAARGLLRVVREGRSSRYLAEDVERLRLRAAVAAGREAAAADALDWGAPLLASAITTFDVDGPSYRGRSAVALVRAGVAFEPVFDHLTAERGAWGPALAPPALPAAAGPVPRLLGATACWLAAGEDAASPDGRRRVVRGLVAALADPADAERAASAPTVAEALAVALRAPPGAAPVIDGALVACADHELNPSAFAARVAAGTGASPLACLIAALAAFSGARHGGAPERVAAALAGGRTDAGFGHRLYPGGDPRAAVLRELAARVRPDPALDAWVAAGEATTGERATLDVGLVAVARALDLPAAAGSALFAVGRTAGWFAHAAEQAATGRLLRPRARRRG